MFTSDSCVAIDAIVFLTIILQFDVLVLFSVIMCMCLFFLYLFNVGGVAEQNKVFYHKIHFLFYWLHFVLLFLAFDNTSAQVLLLYVMLQCDSRGFFAESITSYLVVELLSCLETADGICSSQTRSVLLFGVAININLSVTKDTLQTQTKHLTYCLGRFIRS